MGIKTRRWWAVVAAVFTALALFVAPKTALADTTSIYRNNGFEVYADTRAGAPAPDIQVQVCIDGQTVQEMTTVSGVTYSGTELHVSVPEAYEVQLEQNGFSSTAWDHVSCSYLLIV